MTKVNHDHLLIVVVGMFFIAGFVFIAASSGNFDDIFTGMATGFSDSGNKIINCTDTEIPPTAYAKGTITVTSIEVNSIDAEQTTTIYEDECLSNKVVREYGCKGSSPVMFSLNCIGNAVCNNGICSIGSAPVQCTDTDNGRNYYQKGTTRGTNPVTGVFVTYIDTCISGTEDIMEGFCFNGVPINERSTCENGCDDSEGRCIQPPPPQPYCRDMDQGINPLSYGLNFNNTVAKGDVCLSTSTIREWECDEFNLAKQEVECPAGTYCDVSRCSSEPFTHTSPCFDTDGNDINEYGILWNNGETFEDVCINENTITEYACNGQAVYIRNASCSEGFECLAGECVVSHIASCVDSDGGINTGVKGIITLDGVVAHTDKCSPFTVNAVIEGSCNGGEVITTHTSCGNNVCSNGACVQSEDETQERSMSTVASRINITNSTNGSVVRSSSPSSGVGVSGNQPVEMSLPGNGGTPVRINYSCVDSDGGINKFVAGYARGYTANGSSIGINDTCYGNFTVNEAYCGNFGPVSGLYSCGSNFICYENRCVANNGSNGSRAMSSVQFNRVNVTNSSNGSGVRSSVSFNRVNVTNVTNNSGIMGASVIVSTKEKAEVALKN
ncbi:MAG: hypothetical protein WC758_04810 [Candidatus Woesearchaeota archaeon]|jgi:hypothetical protein